LRDTPHTSLREREQGKMAESMKGLEMKGQFGGCGCEDDGGRMVVVRGWWWENGSAIHIEERKKMGVVDLQQCPCFKFEKSKMSMVSNLCQEKCV